MAYTTSQSRLSNNARSRTLETIYGPAIISEPVLLDLLESPSMLRLKSINQYGISAFVRQLPPYTRYDHSLGVLVLLQRYGASLPEQIAGLLHDVSHTVFSHVADHLFKHQSDTNSYQDDIHAWFLGSTELAALLERHGFTVDEILHKQSCFKALEQDLPDICADRLEYTLQGGFIEQIITHDDLKALLNALRFENGVWFFTDVQRAVQFATISLHLTEHTFGSLASALIYRWAGQALRHALTTNLITEHEIHFSTDQIIWDILTTSKDSVIQNLMHKIINHEQCYRISDATDYDLIIHQKFRGINPWVQMPQGLQRLTEADQNFAHAYFDLKNRMHQGWYVKLLYYDYL